MLFVGTAHYLYLVQGAQQVKREAKQMASNYKGPLDYIDVATRIVEFREKYPTGSLQQLDLKFVFVNGKDWVVYTAAAYRTPDDIRPGVGTAWEPIPGPTSFTRDSEVQNAETAAWGRAMVAALAVDTKKGIASSEEVRNRSEKTTDKPVVKYTDEQVTLATDAIGLLEVVTTVDELRNFYTGANEAGILHIAVNGTTLNAAIGAKKKALEIK